MEKDPRNYGRFFKLLISYLFSLSACYAVFFTISRTGNVFSFPVSANLCADPMAANYTLLIIFLATSAAAFFMHRNGLHMLMHGISLALLVFLAAGVYINSWFEYENVFASTAALFGLALYLNSFLKRAVAGAGQNSRAAMGTAAIWIFAVFAVIYALYFSNLAILRHDLFMSHKFDLAWENQALYNLAFTGIPYSSLGYTGNNFGDHFSLIYYLVGLFYRFYTRPEFLLVFQVLIMVFSSFLIYLLAKNMLKDGFLACVFAFLFLLHPAVQGMMLFDFHPGVIAIPLFLLVFYFVEKGSLKLFLLPFFALFFVREDIAFAAAFIPVFLASVNKIPKKYGAYLLISAILLNLAIMFSMDMLGNVKLDVDRFYYLFPGAAGILSLFAVNPVFEIVQAFTAQKIGFLALFSAPLLFLCFFRRENLILLFPALLFTVFSKHVPQYTLGYQYGAVFLAYAFYLSLEAFSGLKFPFLGIFTGRYRVAIFMLAIALPMSLLYGNFFSKSFKLTWLGCDSPVGKADYCYNDFVGCFKKIPGEVDHEAVKLLDSIPAKYTVKADVNIMPHVSGRRELYNVFFVRDTDLVIVFNREPFIEFEKTGFPGKEYVRYKSTKTIIIYVNKKLKDFNL